MKVKTLMIRDVKFCSPLTTLNTAAQIMWDNDCGCVPVVDQHMHVLGVLTDRDICMAAYTQGVSLKEAEVSSAMSKKVYSCRADDDLATAEQRMRENKVRRLPVTDAENRLIGILSLNDIAREAGRERSIRAVRQITETEIAQILASVCEPRQRVLLAQAA